MKLRLKTTVATAICLSAIDGLDEPLLVTAAHPVTRHLPDDVAEAILDSVHGHAFEVFAPDVIDMQKPDDGEEPPAGGTKTVSKKTDSRKTKSG